MCAVEDVLVMDLSLVENCRIQMKTYSMVSAAAAAFDMEIVPHFDKHLVLQHFETSAEQCHSLAVVGEFVS